MWQLTSPSLLSRLFLAFNCLTIICLSIDVLFNTEFVKLPGFVDSCPPSNLESFQPLLFQLFFLSPFLTLLLWFPQCKSWSIWQCPRDPSGSIPIFFYLFYFHSSEYIILIVLFSSFLNLSSACLNTFLRTSSQDRGTGRYTLPPCTTKKRTTNLKTKNNQNCQKIKLYGSLTTKELKEETFIHTSRMGGDGQLGQRECMARWRLADEAGPHLHVDKPEGTTGEWDRLWNPGFQHGKRKLQNLWL